MPFQNQLYGILGMFVYLLVVLFVPSSYAFPQHHTTLGATPLENTFQNALTLFEQKHYEAAQKTFSSYLDATGSDLSPQQEISQTLEATYYIRLCELYLKKPYSERNSVEFISTYQHTYFADRLTLALANAFYEEGNYRKAAYYYASLEKSRPTEQEELEINFRLAYSYFKIRRTDKALRTFSSLQSKNNEYYAQASYYVGFINYELGNFEKAIENLTKAKADKKYVESSNKLIAQSYYGLKDCDGLSNFLSSIAQEKHEVELFYYAAQCAYLNNDFDLAYEWFGRYKRNSKQLSDSAAYQYLNTLYETEKYDEFLDYEMSSLAGGEYYSPILLMKAGIYEKKNNYKKAATVYDELAAYNPSGAEKAYFSKLKNLYLSEEYEFLFSESKKFEEKFPQSDYLPEVIMITTNALTIGKDFQSAMNYLKTRDSNKKNIRKNELDKMYVNLALEAIKKLFNQSSYDEMRGVMSELSNTVSINDSLQNFIHFYTAEALLQETKVGEAENIYKKIPVSSQFYADSKYGLGVINFNKASYSSRAKQDALTFLEEYLKSSRELVVKEKAVDALTRLATIYASNGHNQEAEINFMKALQFGDYEVEYINFSLGQIYFVQNDYNKAIERFDLVMQTPNSLYAQYSQLMKAKIYESKSERKKVILLLNDFIKRYPQSEKLAEALYSRGNAWNGLGNNKNAINDYTALISNYPTSEKATLALNTLEDYADFGITVGNIEELRNIYASHNSSYNLDAVTVSGSGLGEGVKEDFEIAFKLYKKNEFSGAIARFRDIISKNDIAGTAYYDPIYYYLGKSYQYYGDNNQAIKNLQRVGGKMQTGALSDMGDIEFGRGNYNSAITHYKSLEKIAPNDDMRMLAWENLTKTYAQQGDYATANNYLAIIRNKKALANNDFVRLYENKILAGQEQIDEAIEGLSKLGNDRQANPKYASEALYELAKLMHTIGDTQSAKSILQDLRKEFAEQTEVQVKANKLALLLD
ncbi:tetratricopeptide repeat protein [Bernardetia sp.]|uniref:tetratricopeptide repeat protein n=1 Tax=Bernardetia sp. TaxID=1937974 RepID=UPI0025C518A0|nr:tetratricopeptide repeat protein [Bernardetia sp.]